MQRASIRTSIVRARGIAAVLLVVSLTLLSSTTVQASSVDDAHIAGYAVGVLEREFRFADAWVSVKDGVVTVHVDALGGVPPDRVITSLGAIRGVKRVRLFLGDEQPPEGVGDAVAQVAPPDSSLFPPGLLVAPFHADPRWPHFSGAVRFTETRLPFSTVFAGNFGETFAIYRQAAPGGGFWEVSVQAGVFSLFDLLRENKDLINADYLVAGLASYRNGNLSGFLRLLHQSSHLGDEFLLHQDIIRVNRSWEMVDLKLSYDWFNWLRTYGGAGLLVRRDPGELRPWTTQYGIELSAPWTILNGWLRPVAFGDFQTVQQRNWTTSVSLMAGFQIEPIHIGGRRIQVLAEYYSGLSPNGQFFLTERSEWIGFGLHLWF